MDYKADFSCYNQLLYWNFYEHKRIAGSTKMTEELHADGKRISRRMAAEIMHEKGLQSRTVMKYKATTNSNHDPPVAPNLLQRTAEERINPQTEKPRDKYERIYRFSSINMAWVSDITYIATDEDWLYLTGIMDLFGKELVG